MMSIITRATLVIFVVLCVFSCIRMEPYPQTGEKQMLKVMASIGNRDTSMFHFDRIYPLTGGSMIHPNKIDSLYVDMHLTVNGVPVEIEKMYDMDTLRATYFTLNRFVPGDKVVFEAFAEGFPKVSSETIIPRSPEGDIESVRVVSGEDDRCVVEVVISDPEDSEDYYAVCVEAVPDGNYHQNPELVRLFVRTEGLYQNYLHYDTTWLLINDRFTDSSSKMRFTASQAGVTKARAIVRRISKEYYYGRINVIENSFGFSNTSSVSYSNIEGGIGCFASYCEYVSEWIEMK